MRRINDNTDEQRDRTGLQDQPRRLKKDFAPKIGAEKTAVGIISQPHKKRTCIGRLYRLEAAKNAPIVQNDARSAKCRIDVAMWVKDVFDQAIQAGRVKRGDLVCFAAFGAGFTWGASLVRW